MNQAEISLSNSDGSCPVCLSPFHPENPSFAACVDKVSLVAHRFHFKCINDWYNRGHTTCPVCSRNLPDPSEQLLNLVKQDATVSSIFFKWISEPLAGMILLEAAEKGYTPMAKGLYQNAAIASADKGMALNTALLFGQLQVATLIITRGVADEQITDLTYKLAEKYPEIHQKLPPRSRCTTQ